jgi:hypothetical protein
MKQDKYTIGTMKLENQVTSLELSKQLKELGVKQESHFCWVTSTEYVTEGTLSDGTSRYDSENYTYYSAFTVAELGEMLREEEFELPTYLSSTKEWVAVYETTLIGGSNTEADARGKCLIYLLENKLISL